QHSEILEAPLFSLGRDFIYQQTEQEFFWESRALRRHLPKPRIHPANAALAIQALGLLPEKFNVPEQAVRDACLDIQLPGRLQFFPAPAPLLADVSHNPHAVRNLAEHLRENYAGRRILAVFS